MGGISFFNLPPNDWCPDGKTAYIGNMFTLTDYRKQGIATKILSLLVEEAETLGCERILLNPTDMGKPVYGKYGFELANKNKLYHMHIHDALGKKNHLDLGTGELDLPKYFYLANKHNCRVVLETKTISGLKHLLNG